MQLSDEDKTQEGIEERTKDNEEPKEDTFQGILQSVLDEILQDIHEASKGGATSESEKGKANQKMCMLEKT